MKKVNDSHKEKIMDMIEKAGSEEYEVSWDEKGIPKLKKKSEVKKGRTSKAKGARFELKVRKDLEDKGRTVDKWSNNVDLEEQKIIPAKRKYNPFRKAMMLSSGFPDFVSIKKISEGSYSVIGVEVKVNGILSKIEKEKCRFYLQQGTFSNIWIAKAVQEGRKINIKYEDFEERYGKKNN